MMDMKNTIKNKDIFKLNIQILFYFLCNYYEIIYNLIV